jgi:hypothetical protein
MVFVSSRVLVMCRMGKDPMAVALVLTSPADHSFLLVVIAFPVQDQRCLVFSLTLFRGKCRNTGIIFSSLTPVLCNLLTMCLSIDARQWL